MRNSKINLDEELNRFRVDISLADYAAYTGFCENPRNSTKQTIVTRKEDDVIIISKSATNHWVYSSVFDDKDIGSIIDFIQKREPLSLGEIGVRLRSWLKPDTRPGLSFSTRPRSINSSGNRALNATAEFQKLRPINESKAIQDYLTPIRKIPIGIVLHARFKNRLFSDRYNNTLFPHFRGNKVLGWEVKNTKFMGYLPRGSSKSLWRANRKETDRFLLVTETGIDCLSYYALFPERLEDCWGISTGGAWGSATTEMIKHAIALNPGQTILSAFDNNRAGDSFHERLTHVCETLKVDRIVRKSPDLDDWNNVLKHRSNQVNRSDCYQKTPVS